MSILIRYLIRSHIGPFLFAFTLITGLLFLNTIAQRLDSLVGKGLPWTIIAQFALLALPHTVALTLPMAVLVAVLFAFSDLTAENEITAMTAGGVNPVRLLMPLVGIGIILAGLMFIFNDQVLPEANHALRKLLADVSHKTPTFQLREQVLNEFETVEEGGMRRTFFLSAVHIDPVTSVLEDVIITDAGDPNAKRTTYADRGVMSFNETQTDLFLTLNDGVVLEIPGSRPGALQVAGFEEQFLPIRGIANMLERGMGTERRTDREMSTTMLADSAKGSEARSQEFLDDVRSESLYAVRKALGWQMVGDSMTPPLPMSGQEEFLDPEEEFASGPVPPDELTSGAFLNARTSTQQAKFLQLSAIQKMVEVHKKYSISFACIVFVLLGAPLAVRFPRGGVGMVVTASVVIFALFWTSLIGGETLADDGYVSPALAMWLPNLVFLPLGILMVRRISSQVATARAGGWDDLTFTLVSFLKRPFSRASGAEGE